MRHDSKNLIVDTMENQPYDAKVELDQSFSDESIDTADTGTPKMRKLPKDACKLLSAITANSGSTDSDVLKLSRAELQTQLNQWMFAPEALPRGKPTIPQTLHRNGLFWG